MYITERPATEIVDLEDLPSLLTSLKSKIAEVQSLVDAIEEKLR